MQPLNHQPTNLNPDTFHISREEFNYLNKIQDPIFKELNEKHKNSLLYKSDSLLCIIILICRQNNEYPQDITKLIPLLIKHNTQNHKLN